MGTPIREVRIPTLVAVSFGPTVFAGMTAIGLARLFGAHAPVQVSAGAMAAAVAAAMVPAVGGPAQPRMEEWKRVPARFGIVWLVVSVIVLFPDAVWWAYLTLTGVGSGSSRTPQAVTSLLGLIALASALPLLLMGMMMIPLAAIAGASLAVHFPMWVAGRTGFPLLPGSGSSQLADLLTALVGLSVTLPLYLPTVAYPKFTSAAGAVTLQALILAMPICAASAWLEKRWSRHRPPAQTRASSAATAQPSQTPT